MDRELKEKKDVPFSVWLKYGLPLVIACFMIFCFINMPQGTYTELGLAWTALMGFSFGASGFTMSLMMYFLHCIWYTGEERDKKLQSIYPS